MTDDSRKSRTPARRRGRPKGKRTISQCELDLFCQRLAMGWKVQEAASSIGRSKQALYQLRKRRRRFAQDWADAEKQVLLREEDFFSYVRELGFPGLAASEAGLTFGYVYDRMRTDPIFKQRCDSAKARRISALWREAAKGADDDLAMRWKVLQAMAPDLFR